MPFDGSGNYALSDTIAPATNADANELQAILTDIGTALDACVVADGQSPISGALKGSDGTAALPAYSFNADLNSGFYRIGADNVGLSLGGTKRIDFGTAGTVITGTFGVSGDVAVNTNKVTITAASGNIDSAGVLTMANGAVGAPSHSFTNDADCGMYRIGANNIGLAVNGAKVLDIATTGLTVTGLLTSTSKTVPTTQRLTSGSAATFTPTAGAILWRVRMVGPGAGGGGATANVGNASASDTSFQVNSTGTAWTAKKGSAGGAGTGGTGGAGGVTGTDGSTGNLVTRMAGGYGTNGNTVAAGGKGGEGGCSVYGGSGRGGGGSGNGAGQVGAPNSGAGGGGGGANASGGGGGGGAGEYVEFWVTGMTTATYTVPAGGTGGVAGTQAGGDGAAAGIIIEEFYS